MTTYAWPAAWALSQCSVYLRPNVREFESQYSGAWQAVDLLGERFVMVGRLPPVLAANAGAREAFFNRLRGVHLITAWHFARPRPLGTQRASPTLSASVAQGAVTLPMANGTNGATFLAGDMIGVGGQLFQVAETATFNGSGLATVTTVNRARAALSNGAAVTWDKPTASWRLASPVAVVHEPMVTTPLDIELVQVW